MNRCVSMSLLALSLSGVGLLGCKDQAKCDEALATSRKAMQDDFLDMALARQWRDRAGELCGAGSELDTLDKEILAKEAAIVKAAEDKAKAEAEAGQKAIEKAGEIWAKFDKLDDKKRDLAALKKHDQQAKKLTKDLTPEYAKQVTDYNKQQFQKRKKALDKKK